MTLPHSSSPIPMSTIIKPLIKSILTISIIGSSFYYKSSADYYIDRYDEFFFDVKTMSPVEIREKYAPCEILEYLFSNLRYIAKTHSQVLHRQAQEAKEYGCTPGEWGYAPLYPTFFTD